MPPSLFPHQKYRHVDYIQFENPFLIERFLNYWRSTGNQRIGLMYGRYEHHKDIPLGIKAVVAAIYEPPQVRERMMMLSSFVVRISCWAKRCSCKNLCSFILLGY